MRPIHEEGERVKKTRKNWHQARKRAILKLYPEVGELIGHDLASGMYCFLTVVLQTLMATVVIPQLKVQYVLVSTYVVSGTINHSLTFAIHELSHSLFFKKPLANKVFGLIANLPIGFPIFATFCRYHHAHHAALNVDGVDADLPSEWEIRVFDSKLGRFFWLMLQPVMYGLRPLIEQPKRPNMWQFLNFVTQGLYCSVIYRWGGLCALMYLLLGSLLGLGLHPISGHFIAEHYELFKGQQTSSYYGIMNMLTYNVGYHVEHHDFPHIPGKRLPELRSIASEFYLSSTIPHGWL